MSSCKFFIVHENIRSFWIFLRISFICSWRYCVVRNMVLRQHLSWCSGLHRLSYISCWQNRRRCLCAYQKLLHIDPYGQFFGVSCILWDNIKQLYSNYYWCLQTTRQIKNSRNRHKIEWSFAINFTIWLFINSWRPLFSPAWSHCHRKLFY